MSSNPFVQQTQLNRKEIVESTPGVASAARWFWWIVGLSLVNTVLIHSGSETSFMIGLGFTLVADVIFREIPAIALVIDAFALGFFFLMGWLSLRGHLWAFILGAMIYALDGLIYLYFQDWMPLAFHGLALFYILGGANAFRRALKEASATVATEPPVVAESPTTP